MKKAVELKFKGHVLRGMLQVPEMQKGKYPFIAMYHGFGATKLESHFMFADLSHELEKSGIGSLRFDFSGTGESDGLFEDMTVLSEIYERT